MGSSKPEGEDGAEGGWLSAILRRVPSWRQIRSFDTLLEVCPMIHSVHLFTDRELVLEWTYARPEPLLWIHTRNSRGVLYLEDSPTTFLTLPIEGSLTQTHAYGRMVARAGQSLMISDFRTSRLEFSHGYRCVYAIADTAALQAYLAASDPEAPPLESLHGLYPLAEPRIAALAQAFARAGEAVEAGAVAPARGAELNADFARLLLAGPAAMRREAPNSGAEAPARTVRAAVDYMAPRLAEKISMADLKAVCGVSERSIQAAFSRAFDLSPWACLRMKRLERARDLLADPACRLTVAEIAEACGFNHFSQFSNDYRDYFGETPKRTSVIFRSDWNRWRATMQLATQPTAAIKKRLDRYLRAGA